MTEATTPHDIAEDVLLVFTDSAARKVGELIKEEGNPNLRLRVFVSGGGCSGLQYGMTFDDEVRDGDTSWDAHGLRMIVDPISANYLTGASIDYQSDNMLAGAFKIDNPNAVSSCGCGHSFRAKDQAAADEYDGYDQGYAGGGCGACGHG